MTQSTIKSMSHRTGRWPPCSQGPRIRPKVIESDDPEKALAERLELCAAHNPVRRKRCEGLKRELDKAFGSSDPLPDHLFRQIANVFGDNGPAYVIWWLELLLARSLCIFVRQVEPFFQSAGSNVLLLVDAVRTLKSGAAEPSVEKLLRSFELPGVSMGFSNWANCGLGDFAAPQSFSLLHRIRARARKPD